MKIETDNCYNIDCNLGMKYMQEQNILADWCITDPPYGINNAQARGGEYYSERVGKYSKAKHIYKSSEWDKERISKDTFDLMCAVSKEQIIFGGNYYTDYFPPTKNWVIWDKRDGLEFSNCFPDCELAYASKGNMRIFRYLYNGFMQGSSKYKKERFHPTQKPVELWLQILNFYTKENDIILDPFAGSQSLHIACNKTNRRYIGFEIDKEYWERGNDWVKREREQISFFDK